MLLSVMQKILKAICYDKYRAMLKKLLSEKWLSDGGQSTLDGLRRLPRLERDYLLEYLLEFTLYEKFAWTPAKHIMYKYPK